MALLYRRWEPLPEINVAFCQNIYFDRLILNDSSGENAFLYLYSLTFSEEAHAKKTLKFRDKMAFSTTITFHQKNNPHFESNKWLNNTFAVSQQHKFGLTL